MEKISALELPDIPEPFFEKANTLFSELNTPGIDLITKLEMVYRYLDDFSGYVSGFASCQKGCSHCCSYDVQITTFEAEYIYLKVGVPHNQETSFSINNNRPCPFLAPNQQCAIYAYRPVVCRTFHALGDPENCKDGKDQYQYGSPRFEFSNPIYKRLVEWVHFQNIHADGNCKDIRDFFPFR